jgi:hypothetical protein
MAGQDSGSEAAGAPRPPRRAEPAVSLASPAGVAVDRPEAGRNRAGLWQTQNACRGRRRRRRRPCRDAR